MFDDERRQRLCQISPRTGDRERAARPGGRRGAARELPQISLDDALRICLVLRDGDRGRYDRAAVRWLGRFALEARAVTIAGPRAAGAALGPLPSRTAEAMEQLQRLCVARGIH